MYNTSMKLISTNRRMKLHQEGYPYALRFNSAYSKNAEKVEQWLTDRYGSKWRDGSDWYGMMGVPQSRGGVYCRPYFIGLKNKEMATMVMLAMS